MLCWKLAHKTARQLEKTPVDVMVLAGVFHPCAHWLGSPVQGEIALLQKLPARFEIEGNSELLRQVVLCLPWTTSIEVAQFRREEQHAPVHHFFCRYLLLSIYQIHLKLFQPFAVMIEPKRWEGGEHVSHRNFFSSPEQDAPPCHPESEISLPILLKQTFLRRKMIQKKETGFSVDYMAQPHSRHTLQAAVRLGF